MDPPSPLEDPAFPPDQPDPDPAPPPHTTQSTGGPRFSSGSHIRSRITVVCAECKRLKLKCDRRAPCGSCRKRDTVHRCLYSAAAAEKIDVQSLHNRLQIVESQVAQIYAGGVRTGPVPTAGPLTDNLPFPHNDRTVLATGMSGSSVTISLDDVAALWIEHIDLPHASPSDPSSSSPFAPGPSSPQVKLEPSIDVSTAPDEVPFFSTLPPLSIYYPHGSTTAVVSPTLIALLPAAPSLRSRIVTAIDETMRMHPCFNVKNFKYRSDSMFSWAKEEDLRTGSAAPSNSKSEIAKTIFFPSSTSSDSTGSLVPPARPTPTLSFFACVAAAYALGIQACKENEAATNEVEAPKGGHSSKTARLDDGARLGSHKQSAWHKTSASGLYALSLQALAAFEMTHSYDLDYLIACILQLLFLLHDGRPHIAHTAYPLVGKMVNAAQLMGLATDPDEFPGRYTLFEAEARRRVWWDVYYYDVFVADCVGHAPTIQDNSYTTKMPADVDEEQFGPQSTSLPVPVPRRAGGDPSEVGFAYFTQKCRLAQLVKSVKKRSFKDPLNVDSQEPSLELAEEFEAGVKTWLEDLPRAFRLDSILDAPAATPSAASSSNPPVSPYLQAQRCELAIIANRLILKTFLPFLRHCSDPAPEIVPRRVVSSIVDAGHAVIHAVSLLHNTWRQTRPAAFAFYSFGRTLFDAAVMVASAVIVYPRGASSGVSLADLGLALDLMRDTRTAAMRNKQSASGGAETSEAVKVVEMLKDRAESARHGEHHATSHAGTKRKRSEVEAPSLDEGFQLPYVGTGVALLRTAPETVVIEPAPPRASTSAAPKVRVKQRESSVAPDLSGAFEAAPGEKPLRETLKESLLKAQIPVRGRPRQPSTARPSKSASKQQRQMPAPPPSASAPITVPSQHAGSTEPPGIHPLPDLALGESSSRASVDYSMSAFSPVDTRRFSTAEPELSTPHSTTAPSLPTPSAYDPSPQITHYPDMGPPPPAGQAMHESMFSAQSSPPFSTQPPSPYEFYNMAAGAYGSPQGYDPQQQPQQPQQPQGLIGLGISTDSRPHTAGGPEYLIGGNLASSIPTRRGDVGGQWTPQGSMSGHSGTAPESWEYPKYY
ncbi:hypothetical protein FA95DRAFT_1606603 [Auriscalpium vulgare]|uniref:Uncharacterized protein n=1 Tax=Auriscalpium vulgare TaxID=40419 RepID=A0ACB8RRI2_9AGAM|nr:hypothetical protein FA95DRAFT_1606603 [Auriscalpium vulgare]